MVRVRIKRPKQKILTILFLVTGAWGVGIGSFWSDVGGLTSLYVTILGVVNLSLGGFIGYWYLTRPGPPPKSRKRKK